MRAHFFLLESPKEIFTNNIFISAKTNLLSILKIVQCRQNILTKKLLQKKVSAFMSKPRGKKIFH